METLSPLHSALPAQIVALLSTHDSLSAAELQRGTGKSQASVSLAMASLGERVTKLGAARSTRYALVRDILGLAANQPIHRTDEAGKINEFGVLTQLNNLQIVVRSGPKQWISRPGTLPWFLRPLRPQGFLGRQYTQLRPDFPNDPDDWTAEQALYVAINHAVDSPGAFGLGEITGRLIADSPSDVSARLRDYDQRAQRVNQTLPARSSAGGEQPKFLVEGSEGGEWHHCVVKFSPPRESPFGARWRALLHLEHLAQTTLAAHGVAVAKTEILESATRTYLQSRRFDRVGLEGKRHVVAIDSVHDEFVGTTRVNWVQTAAALESKRLITSAEASAVARIFAFGQYIGNTDMHFGNLSFFVDDVAAPTLQLAPVYDMLPMIWRPDVHTGELGLTHFVQPHLAPAYAREQEQAREWAIHFWQRAVGLEALDDELRRACERNLTRIRVGE